MELTNLWYICALAVFHIACSGTVYGAAFVVIQEEDVEPFLQVRYCFVLSGGCKSKTFYYNVIA